MLNKKIEKALNDQVAREAQSSFQYLAMASWLENNGFMGTSRFLYNQVQEEYMHMMKLFHYVNEAGGNALAPAVKQVDHNFKGYAKLFAAILENEQKVSAAIHDIVDLCLKEKDYTTFNFLQWYVSEQLEEENLFKEINDKINMLGDNRDSLYLLDRDLETMPNRAKIASKGAVQ